MEDPFCNQINRFIVVGIVAEGSRALVRNRRHGSTRVSESEPDIFDGEGPVGVKAVFAVDLN